MFGPPGVAYVYLVYGTSHCVNVVTGPEGFPAAVLLRAGEPLEGCRHSTTGPGNLCRALGITRRHGGLDLVGDVLFLEDAPPPSERIVAARRVNVHYAGPWADRPWRYLLLGSPFVSRPRPVPPTRRRS
jgi:DNA-3-methyladenine glycosylase